MSKNEVEKIISNIDDNYIDEANEYMRQRNKRSFRIVKRIGTVAACFAVVTLLSMSTLTIATAAGNTPAYDILYSLYPDVAKRLTPVNVYCEDNGIRMEVQSIYVHDDTAEIYISIKDLEGDRIDETTDLFDSCEIGVSSDSISTCAFIDYDEEEKQATFLINLQQKDDRKISGRKMVVSVSKFLSGKQETERELPEIVLVDAQTVSEVRMNIKERGYGYQEGYENCIEQISGFLLEREDQSFSPAEGATVTAYGFIDGKLHIQVHYEDILNTDNHGCLYLIDPEENIIEPCMNVEFWDEEQKGIYEEYIFDVSAKDDLTDYTVLGNFMTCSNLITGDWEVTFPIENRD